MWLRLRREGRTIHPRAVATGVTVESVDLDAGDQGDWKLLSHDELERAQRFASDVSRARFVAGRAALRRALATIAAVEPAQLVFDYAEHGRPELPSYPEVSFNLSHSEGVGLLAISTCGRVGVDVEIARPDFADMRIADRFFAPGEISRLRAVPAADRNLAFLRCWTRKEALLKALGAGLTLPLRGFEVSLEAAHPPQLLDAGTVLGAGRWQLTDVSDLVPGAIAAVALDARITSDPEMPMPAT